MVTGEIGKLGPTEEVLINWFWRRPPEDRNLMSSLLPSALLELGEGGGGRGDPTPEETGENGWLDWSTWAPVAWVAQQVAVAAKQTVDQCCEACPCTRLRCSAAESTWSNPHANWGACKRAPSPSSRPLAPWEPRNPVLPRDVTMGQRPARRLDSLLRFPVSSTALSIQPVHLIRHSIDPVASRHSRETSLVCRQLLDKAAGGCAHNSEKNVATSFAQRRRPPTQYRLCASPTAQHWIHAACALTPSRVLTPMSVPSRTAIGRPTRSMDGFAKPECPCLFCCHTTIGEVVQSVRYDTCVQACLLRARCVRPQASTSKDAMALAMFGQAREAPKAFGDSNSGLPGARQCPVSR
ncbi:hypothetical protein B0T14DRAFT_166897 [Immersiella caudata]|uniref:Uncharacterized protein n=1 Tax=Immersiella caudata TaxID=314043 RepID=A0AA39WWZ8_9PEZI|nr:hypothetical protein B0T14DRAFT_166897 [Immersiella caudata]